jgi:hypothetical protein
MVIGRRLRGREPAHRHGEPPVVHEDGVAPARAHVAAKHTSRPGAGPRSIRVSTIRPLLRERRRQRYYCCRLRPSGYDRFRTPHYLASGSGRSWNRTALLVVPFPPSMWKGVRVLMAAQRPRPFQPASGSSIRPSTHFV